MRKIEKGAKFWDYDTKKMDFRNPKVLLWYLNRKLKFGDLKGIKKSDLKKCFSKLNVSDSLKELLKNYFHKSA
jgi:hypothetical protein